MSFSSAYFLADSPVVGVHVTVCIIGFLTDHPDVCQILKVRLEVLKKARTEWSMSEPKVGCV